MANSKTTTKPRRQSQPAKLARIKAAAARQRTIPADEIIYLNDLTPAQAKRLNTMTTAQLKALAKRQAKARRKAVRS